MSKISPARKRSLGHNLETTRAEQHAPGWFEQKRARPSAVFPLAVMNCADYSIPSADRHIFIDNDKSICAEYSTDLTHYQLKVLCVMQYVAE